MSEKLILSKEEKLVIRMLNSACAQAACEYESHVLTTLLNVLSNLGSGRTVDAVDNLSSLKE